ncbi:maleylpyruvate isomerase N-terminal domain-containing protein [Kitasatospora sp. NBC_00240]|uniref:maleylpyruvate isomerase N-terminal domain-containing protein n=1 Tax=Kitasatospora sp. NBC_00240 TaxID=2903567 RepID=UPI00224DE559|nr:maleylpyruvate isomerase N-terminal domain-containing protein [Kitasatospora sp. NBC_00240]MCX5208018.1 maleylpyruvate isomerase N-terminal domain-containing protein [Kitasatospora sp. NBC_00240]
MARSKEYGMDATDGMSAVRRAYLETARTARDLLAEPAVAAAWHAPGALDLMTVGDLAGHLAGQTFLVPQVLAEPVPAAHRAPLPLLDYYAAVRWIGSAPDHPVNLRIRRAGAEAGAEGPQALAARTTATVDALRRTLPAEPPDRLVHLPRGPWTLRLDDFLVSRMMELAVHTDDLAFSVGLPTPPIPAAGLDTVIRLLTRLSVRRHGPTALLRTLARAERAPATVAAF